MTTFARKAEDKASSLASPTSSLNTYKAKLMDDMDLQDNPNFSC